MTINVFSDPSSKNLSIYTQSGRASLLSFQTYGIESKSFIKIYRAKRKIVSKQISKTKNIFLMQLVIELKIKLGKKIKYPCSIRCEMVCRK